MVEHRLANEGRGLNPSSAQEINMARSQVEGISREPKHVFVL